MSFQNLENMSQLAIAQFVYVYDEILKEKSMSHGPATGMELKALMEEAIYQEKKTEIVEDAMEEEREEDVEVVEEREEAVEVIDLGDEPEENETPTLAPKDVLKAIKADFNYKQEVEEGMKPRVHRLSLPYLPGSIDYTQGCQAMCLNGGLCSPCMTRLPKDAGSIFCKACEKKGGCESDRATFLRASSSSKTVTFGTYLAKRNVPTEFVKEWIQKNFGDKLVIPEYEWMVVKEEIKTTKKTKKTTKSAETSSDEESVASDVESAASVPVKKAGLSDQEKAAKKAAKAVAKAAAKEAKKAAEKAKKTAVQEREKAAKKAAKEAKKAAKLANESKLLEKGSMTKKGEFGYKKTKAPLTEEEKAAKKAAKALKKAAKKAEEEKAAAEERSANVPQEAEERSANVPQAQEAEEEEDDYGIKMFFALNGKSYGVDEENTVYEMEGNQPAEIVGTWDDTHSTAVFDEVN
jgi:hypothetical protein